MALQHVTTLVSPLAVFLERKTKADKKFILNFNVYRNTHFQILNQAKVHYKQLMLPAIAPLAAMERIAVRFRLFPATRRLTDLHNICSIHEKFFADALVETGKLPDDTYLHYTESSYVFGAVDKQNPRIEIELYNVIQG